MILPSGSFTLAVTAVLASAAILILKAGLRIIGCLFFRPLLKAKPPAGIKQLSDHVWEFYSPEGDPDREIIFFHGLQLVDFKDAFWETWVAENDKHLVWPREWLSKEFPHARILSISYNSSATQMAGQLSMKALAENLFSDIILDSKHKIGRKCPVFLVAHCFGGIVIKHFIIGAKKQASLCENDNIFQQEQANTFLKNVKGVFYYATPHGGFEVANLASLPHGKSPILELVKTLNTETARANEDFRRYRKNLNVRAFGLAEGLPLKGFNTVVVEEPSTRQDIDYFYTHSTADHSTICKARFETDPTVIEKLAQFIRNSVPENRNQIGTKVPERSTSTRILLISFLKTQSRQTRNTSQVVENEFKEQAKTVDHQPESENTSSPEEPQSHLESTTRKLSKDVESFISLLNDEGLPNYFFSREWWDELEEQETEALMSTFERNAYTLSRFSSTQMCCSRNEDN